jgi:hypothetical protein
VAACSFRLDFPHLLAVLGGHPPNFWTDQINLFFPGGELVRLPSRLSGSSSLYSYIIIFKILGRAIGHRWGSGQLLDVLVHFTRVFALFRCRTSWLGGSLLLLGVFGVIRSGLGVPVIDFLDRSNRLIFPVCRAGPPSFSTFGLPFSLFLYYYF